MFNVVVDTESTGKQLLQNGNLRRRVTIIPLNKIQAHTVPPRVQHAAARLVSSLSIVSPNHVLVGFSFLSIGWLKTLIFISGGQGKCRSGTFVGWL